MLPEAVWSTLAHLRVLPRMRSRQLSAGKGENGEVAHLHGIEVLQVSRGPP